MLSSSQHLIRDLVVIFALALLIPLTTNKIADVIAPMPQFEDFPCQVDNMHCRDVDGKIADIYRKIASLRGSLAKATPEEKAGIHSEIEALEHQREATQSALLHTRQARDKALKDASLKPRKTQTYITLAAGVLALLVGYLVAIFPLQPGLIFGGVITLITGYVFAWDILSNVLKLLALLIALALVVAISLRAYRRET